MERPICFASRTFTKEQRNWSATERELRTLQYFATEHFKQYFFGNPTRPILYTDHKPLTYLFTKRNATNAKLARWSAKLSNFQAEIVYRCGAKMGPTDSFSRLIQGRPERAQRDEETPEKGSHCVIIGVLCRNTSHRTRQSVVCHYQGLKECHNKEQHF